MGILIAISGKYLKLASNARFNRMQAETRNPEGLRCIHFPNRKFIAVEASRTAANQYPQVR
jgi:hypothetical protein